MMPVDDNDNDDDDDDDDGVSTGININNTIESPVPPTVVFGFL